MRRIAESPSRELLDRYHAFLEHQGVSSIVIEQSDGWGVWVDDENQVEPARQWYAEYLLDPNAVRYLEAMQHRELRREATRRAAETEAEAAEATPEGSRRFRLRDLRRAPGYPVYRGVTLGLIAMSLFGALIIDFNLTSPAGRWMAFCDTPRESTGFGTLSDILSGECWRLISPTFVYFDLRHLIFGVIFTYHFGIRIESLRGPIVLGGLCLGGAVVSNLAQALAPTDVAIAGLAGGPSFGGMSAVVFTLFGFIWMQSRRSRDNLLRIDSLTIMVMLFWQIVCIASPDWGFANVGHLTGLSFGAAIGYLYRSRQQVVTRES